MWFGINVKEIFVSAKEVFAEQFVSLVIFINVKFEYLQIALLFNKSGIHIFNSKIQNKQFNITEATKYEYLSSLSKSDKRRYI